MMQNLLFVHPDHLCLSGPVMTARWSRKLFKFVTVVLARPLMWPDQVFCDKPDHIFVFICGDGLFCHYKEKQKKWSGQAKLSPWLLTSMQACGIIVGTDKHLIIAKDITSN